MHNNKRKKRPDLSRLSDIRVVQRNLVYVTNLSIDVAKEDILRKHEYFGRFGKVVKVVVNKDKIYSGPQGPSVSCYITYSHPNEALQAIKTIEGTTIDGRLLRASFGTTKYCTYFLRGIRCPNSECMYLHQMGVEADSFTKEDMAQGKHLLCMFPDQSRTGAGTTNDTSTNMSNGSTPTKPADTASSTSVWATKVSALVSRSLTSAPTIDDQEFPPMDAQKLKGSGTTPVTQPPSLGRGRGEQPQIQPQQQPTQAQQPLMAGRGRGRGQIPQQTQPTQVPPVQQKPQQPPRRHSFDEEAIYDAYDDDDTRDNSSDNWEEDSANSYQQKVSGSPASASQLASGIPGMLSTNTNSTNNNITGNAHKQLRTKPSLLRKPQQWRAKGADDGPQPIGNITEAGSPASISNAAVQQTKNSQKESVVLKKSDTIAPPSTSNISIPTGTTSKQSSSWGQGDTVLSGSPSSFNKLQRITQLQTLAVQTQQLSPQPTLKKISPRAIQPDPAFGIEPSFVVPSPTSPSTSNITPVTTPTSPFQPTPPQRRLRPRKLDYEEDQSPPTMKMPTPAPTSASAPATAGVHPPSSAKLTSSSSTGSANSTGSDFQPFPLWPSPFSPQAVSPSQSWDPTIWGQELGSSRGLAFSIGIEGEETTHTPPSRPSRQQLPAPRRMSLDETLGLGISLFPTSVSPTLLHSDSFSDFSRSPIEPLGDAAGELRPRSMSLGLGLDVHPRVPPPGRTEGRLSMDLAPGSAIVPPSNNKSSTPMPIKPSASAPSAEETLPTRARKGYVGSGSAERSSSRLNDWIKFGFDESFGIEVKQNASNSNSYNNSPDDFSIMGSLERKHSLGPTWDREVRPVRISPREQDSTQRIQQSQQQQTQVQQTQTQQNQRPTQTSKALSLSQAQYIRKGEDENETSEQMQDRTNQPEDEPETFMFENSNTSNSQNNHEVSANRREQTNIQPAQRQQESEHNTQHQHQSYPPPSPHKQRQHQQQQQQQQQQQHQHQHQHQQQQHQPPQQVHVWVPSPMMNPSPPPQAQHPGIMPGTVMGFPAYSWSQLPPPMMGGPLGPPTMHGHQFQPGSHSYALPPQWSGSAPPPHSHARGPPSSPARNNNGNNSYNTNNGANNNGNNSNYNYNQMVNRQPQQMGQRRNGM